MDADERAIYYYVKSLRPNSTSARDISRRVGSKRRFRYNPDWANPVLLRMVERGILETKADGSYALKLLPQREVQGKRWVMPRIAELLKANGKDFDSLIAPEDEDECFEKL